ncbi:MAG: hypothetical protein ABIJ56_22390 [Pseudomonadota bacterium]
MIKIIIGLILMFFLVSLFTTGCKSEQVKTSESNSPQAALENKVPDPVEEKSEAGKPADAPDMLEEPTHEIDTAGKFPVSVSCPTDRERCNMGIRVSTDAKSMVVFTQPPILWGDMISGTDGVCWSEGMAGFLVHCMPLDGAGKSQWIGSTERVHDMAMNSEAVFVASIEGIFSLSKSKEHKKLLADAGYAAIAADADNLYYLAGPNADAGQVMRVSTQGGDATTLISGLKSASAIGIDDAAVYVATFGFDKKGQIMRAPKSGGPSTVIAGKQEQVRALIVDESSVYWLCTSGNGYTVTKADKTKGGSPVTLAAVKANPGVRRHRNRLAQDAGYIYFPAFDRILRVPKAGGDPELLVSIAGDGDIVSHTVSAGTLYFAITVYCSKGKGKCPQDDHYD